MKTIIMITIVESLTIAILCAALGLHIIAPLAWVCAAIMQIFALWRISRTEHL